MIEVSSFLPHIESYMSLFNNDHPEKSRLHAILSEFFPIKSIDYKSYRIIKSGIDEVGALRNFESIESVIKATFEHEGNQRERTLGSIPEMNERGSFIIKGIERAPIAQLLPIKGLLIEEKEDGYEACIKPELGRYLKVKIDKDNILIRLTGLNKDISFSTFADAIGITSEDLEHIAKTNPKAGNLLLKFYKNNKTVNNQQDDMPNELYHLFNEQSSYFLSNTARKQINKKLAPAFKRLNIAVSDNIKHLTKEDFLCIFYYLAELINGSQGFCADDLEHLKNKEILLVGDHLEIAIKKALWDIKRYLESELTNSKDKFDINKFFIHISDIFNDRIREYFTGELCQILDQTNPLSEVSHKRKITFYGQGGIAKEYRGFQRRDVHYSHYGRICPVETPESQKIGLTVHFASHARVKDKQILSPIKCPNNKTRYLTAEQEESLPIAPYSFVNEPPLYIRQGENEMIRYDKKGMTLHRDSYPEQFIGICASLIPFIQHDDVNRALMGAKNLKQSLPLKNPEQPLVKTGFESISARISCRGIYAQRKGVVKAIENGTITIIHEDLSERKYQLMTASPSITGTAIFQKPIVAVGDKVQEGQCLADGPAMKGGELALGVNLLVAYMPWYGYNFEDGIVISDRLVKEDILTSLHMKELIFEIEDDEIVAGIDINDKKKHNRADDLEDDVLAEGISEEGFIKVGKSVEPGDPLIVKYKIYKDKNQLKKGEQPIKVFDKKCLPRPVIERADEDTYGTVVYSNKVKSQGKEKIVIWLEYERKVTVGDKLMGRHGNKGVIAKIIPESDMPRLKDGTIVDVILNPHGVISRMNLGQLLETHLGLKIKKKGESSVTIRPFEPFDIEGLKAKLRALGFTDGKAMLFDAKKKPLTESPVTVGWQYMVKLNHNAQDKEHVRATGNYSTITQQAPRGKSNNGGQRIGEMEEWALLAHRAFGLLEEFSSLKADDVVSRRELMQKIARSDFKFPSEFMPKRTLPESFRVFLVLLKGLGVKPVLELKDDKEVTDFDFLPAYELKDIKGLKVGLDDLTTPVKDSELIEEAGGAKVKEYGELSCGCRGFFDDILYKKNPYICKTHTRVSLGCGCKGTLSEIALLSGKTIKCKKCDKETNIKNILITLECGCDGVYSKSEKGKYSCSTHNKDVKEKANERIKVLWSEDRVRYLPRGMFSEVIFSDEKEVGRRQKWAYIELAEDMPHPLDETKMIRYLPVIPPELRPLIQGSYLGSDLNYLYNQVIINNNRLKNLLSSNQSKGSQISEERLNSIRNRLKQSIKELMIDGAENGGKRYKSILDMLSGKEGLFRQAMLGKRIDFSARAVIVPAPEIKLDEVILPLKIARELFSPWLEGILKRYEGMSKEEIYYVLRSPLEKTRKDNLINVLNSFINDNNIVVVLNRAPSLHRYNLLAFKPIVKDQPVIGLHPLVCGGFNADFDGDQMGVYLPLIAQNEARELLDPYRHVLSIANGEPILHFSQDIVAGRYLEGIAKKQIKEDIKAKYIQLKREDFIDYVQNLMQKGFENITTKGLTISMYDFDKLMVKKSERESILSDLSKTTPIDNNTLYDKWKAEVKKAIETKVKDDPENPLSILCTSGARGDMDTLTQLAGMRGMMESATEPVRANFREGLSPLEFFISTHGSRSSLADKKLRVADAGDLTRRLIYAAMDLLITEDDCGSAEGVTLQKRLYGRYALEDVTELEVKKGMLITKDMAEKLASMNKGLIVRSPLTCKAKKGICKKCYGIDLSTGELPERCLPVGVIAAESIGERGTQLSMRTFHTGGVKGAGQNVGLNKVKKIFECNQEEMQWYEKHKLSSLSAQDKINAIVQDFLNIMRNEYKDAIDDIHFEVILKAMLEEGQNGYELKGVTKVARTKPDFLSRAAFQRAKYEIKNAVSKGQYAPFDTVVAGLLLGGYFDNLLGRCKYV